MKTLKSSIVIENAIVGLNSLKVKDTKFKADGDYHLIALLTKESSELKAVMGHIKKVLNDSGIKINAEIKKAKSPISEKNDGDTIFKSFDGQKNDKGELKGEYLKNTYGIKIRTTKDFKVIDMDRKELDKTQVAWSGALVNIHCSPYIYDNNFGKGLTIILNNIQIVEEGFGGYDSLVDAFGDIKEKEEDMPF